MSGLRQFRDTIPVLEFGPRDMQLQMVTPTETQHGKIGGRKALVESRLSIFTSWVRTTSHSIQLFGQHSLWESMLQTTTER